MSLPSQIARNFSILTIHRRFASQIVKAYKPNNDVTTTVADLNRPQVKIIDEKRLENLITEEENNREIMDKFRESLEEKDGEDGAMDLFQESLTSEDIAKARKLKAETGIPTYRKMVYNNGELSNSCLDSPPSRSNPHPFDPSEIQVPVHSHSMVPFVNHSPILRFLVDIGVDLAEIENTTTIGRFLMRLRMEDVKEKIELLQNSIGFENEKIGGYLTRNPYFLIQNAHDMQARLNYLEMKKFTKTERRKIVDEYRYWLNCNVQLIDSRLGWIQKQFKLTAKLTRELIVKEPRIIMFGTGPLERLIKMMLKELNFSDKQLKELVLADPRLFMMDPKLVSKTYRYVRDVMKINNETIIQYPFILRCSLSVIKCRHDFLRKLGRANYELTASTGNKNDRNKIEEASSETQSIDLINLEDFLNKSDAGFAKLAAKTYPVVYDRFLRNC